MVESRYAKQLSSVYYVVFIVLRVYDRHGYVVPKTNSIFHDVAKSNKQLRGSFSDLALYKRSLIPF